MKFLRGSKATESVVGQKKDRRNIKRAKQVRRSSIQRREQGMANVKEQRPLQQGRAQEHGKQVSEVGGGATALVKTSPAVPIVMNDPCLMYDEDLGRFAKLLAADMDKHVENANNEAKEYNRKLLTNWPVFVEIRSRFDNQGYRTDLIKEGNDADKEHKRTKQDLVRAFGATNHKEWVEKNFPWSVQYHNRRLKALKEASEFTQKLLEEQCDPNQSEDGGNNTGPVRGGVNPGTSHRTRKSDLIRYEHVSHVAFEEAKKYPGHPLANAIKAAALHHKFEPVSGTWRLPETAVDTQIAKLAVEMSEIANGQLGDKLMGNAAGKKLLSHAKQILGIKHQAKKITVKRPGQPLAGFGGTGNCESPSAAVPTGEALYEWGFGRRCKTVRRG